MGKNKFATASEQAGDMLQCCLVVFFFLILAPVLENLLTNWLGHCGLQRLNPSCQTWWQVPSFTEPSLKPDPEFLILQFPPPECQDQECTNMPVFMWYLGSHPEL